MCGIAGMIGQDQAAVKTALALKSLQGRGHQAAGVAAYDNTTGQFTVITEPGVVRNLLLLLDKEPLPGRLAIAHTRYGTSGGSALENAQPFVSDSGHIAIAHNGEIVEAEAKRQKLIAAGATFKKTSDSELILKLLEQPGKQGVIAVTLETLQQLTEAFAVIIGCQGYLIGACDPKAYHPLWLGRLPSGGYMFASEDCAIRAVGARPLKEVKAGQVIVVAPDLTIQEFWLPQRPADSSHHRHCSFNFIYTASPVSKIWGRRVTKVRQALGEALFEELKESECLPVVDVITPVLDSGRTATLAFAKKYIVEKIARLIESGGEKALRQADANNLVCFDFGINREHEPLRNFQLGSQLERENHIELKHSIDGSIVKNKRVIVGDDSIIRGTTARWVVKRLRKFGATEVHFLVFAPPIVASCPYGGMETKDKAMLQAANRGPAELQKFIGADSLQFLSLDKFKSVVGQGYCLTCQQSSPTTAA